MTTPAAPAPAPAPAPAAPAPPPTPVTMIYHQSCSECLLVKETLEKNKVTLRLRDLFSAPLTREELEVLLDGVEDVKPFLNFRSTEHRDRRWDENPPSKELAIDVMSRDIRVLRCPILLKGEDVMPVTILTEADKVPPEVLKFAGVEVKEKKAPPPKGGHAAAAKAAAAAAKPAPPAPGAAAAPPTA